MAVPDYEEETAYAMSWTATGSNPSLGNGTLEAYYTRTGNLVTVTMKLIPGSTSSFGSGTYLFSLPYAVAGSSTYSQASVYRGPARFIDTGTAFYFGHAVCGSFPGLDGVTGAGPNAAFIQQNQTPGFTLFGHNTPFTVAPDDLISFTLTYMTSGFEPPEVSLAPLAVYYRRRRA